MAGLSVQNPGWGSLNHQFSKALSDDLKRLPGNPGPPTKRMLAAKIRAAINVPLPADGERDTVTNWLSGDLPKTSGGVNPRRRILQVVQDVLDTWYASAEALAAGVGRPHDYVDSFLGPPVSAAPRSRPLGQPMRLFPRPTRLDGRERLLADIRDTLQVAGRDRPAVVVLRGMAGIGKTSLATEYGHRHLAEYRWVWEVPVEDPALVAAEFANLAAVLGIRAASDDIDPFAQVHAALAGSEERWLLILDNAERPAEVARALPPAGAGHVLITTQCAHWPAAVAIDVPVLTAETAKAFLLSHASDEDAMAAGALATELGHLPLALEQAAAFMRETGHSMTSYLDLWRRRRKDMLVRGTPAGYDRSVATTFRIALERLAAGAPEAVTLLRLLAQYAPDDVPFRRLVAGAYRGPTKPGSGLADLMAPLLAGELAVDDAIAQLRQYSLTGRPRKDGTVSVHRLVQAVTIDELTPPEQAAWRATAAALIEAVLPDDPDDPPAWPTYRELLAHARVCLPYRAAGMGKLVAYLRASGNYQPARDLQRQVAEACERDLGPDHPDTLAARYRLARALQRCGELVEADAEFQATLDGRRRVLGDDHPDTLHTRHQFAYLLKHRGLLELADAQLGEVIKVRRRSFGEDDPVAVSARHTRASIWRDRGELAKAESEYRALLDIRCRTLGQEARQTLDTRHELAYTLRRLRKFRESEAEFQAVLNTRLRTLGDDHPHTFGALENLAHCIWDQSRLDEVEDLLRQVLAGRCRVLGDRHPNTLLTRYDLANMLIARGLLNEAAAEHRTVLALRREVLGEQHPQTAASREALRSVTDQ